MANVSSIEAPGAAPADKARRTPEEIEALIAEFERNSQRTAAMMHGPTDSTRDVRELRDGYDDEVDEATLASCR